MRVIVTLEVEGYRLGISVTIILHKLFAYFDVDTVYNDRPEERSSHSIT